MNVVAWIFGILGLVVWLACRDLPGNSGRGRVWSSEELDAMNREMVGKSKKECQQILRKYSK